MAEVEIGAMGFSRKAIGRHSLPGTITYDQSSTIIAAIEMSYASASHFFKKLAFAAPESGFPFLSIAFGSQVSFAHFVM